MSLKHKLQCFLYNLSHMGFKNNPVDKTTMLLNKNQVIPYAKFYLDLHLGPKPCLLLNVS